MCARASVPGVAGMAGGDGAGGAGCASLFANAGLHAGVIEALSRIENNWFEPKCRERFPQTLKGQIHVLGSPFWPIAVLSCRISTWMIM